MLNSEEIKTTIAGIITEARNNSKYCDNVQGAADVLGITRQTLHNYENAIRPVPVDILVKMGEIYPIDLAETFKLMQIGQHPEQSPMFSAVMLEINKNLDQVKDIKVLRRILKHVVIDCDTG